MNILLLFACVLVLVIEIYLELRYIMANYPRSWKWRSILFLGGFVITATFLYGVKWNDRGEIGLAVVALLGGLFSGFCFAFLLPFNLQHVYPKL